MKLKFKHQKFQEEAAAAVCDVFAGQPNISSTYIVDKGRYALGAQAALTDNAEITGYNNKKVLISDEHILANLQRVQKQYQIKPSPNLEGKYNLTVEMETGVGKTYTYIKTMFELNKLYGWNKFIIVVPSVAIREGVYSTFDDTCEHFAEDYNKKIRYFIYNSQDLNKIDQFAHDSGICVMIINSQAFNARGKDARRIYMKLDSFRTRRPIDVIAATNPILIIDEPQSVEGAVTKEKLKEFNPLMTLRYSATHRADSMYNMIYRLDALEAYNKRLVKKISVKGISVSGSTATESYLYLERINLHGSKPPTASLEFEVKSKSGIRKVLKNVDVGFNIYEQSGNLDEYKGYTVTKINALSNIVEFSNGVIISAGDVVGVVNEDHIRRIQIRETIKTHFERERQLFFKGIKVLSLFFIDEVAKYKHYDASGTALNGEYGQIFEEEYSAVVAEWQAGIGEDEYLEYRNKIKAEQTHAGYFSIDKKNHFTESRITDKRENISDDADAYDLIMKDKKRLLDLKEPVRFIFSHSALREGWDNPNVFQICTLKQSGTDVRKRQEVGRGLRLCVNNDGDRMDINVLGTDVHNINVLTVIANESYDSFAKRLQTEIADVVADRPKEVVAELFESKSIFDSEGKNPIILDHKTATKIIHSLIKNEYIDDDNALTDKYFEDQESGNLFIAQEFEPYKTDIVKILDTVFNPGDYVISDDSKNNVNNIGVNTARLGMKEFQSLWKSINSQSAYTVKFDTDELVRKAVSSLDTNLHVSQIVYRIEQGEMKDIKSKEALQKGEAFKKNNSDVSKVDAVVNSNVKYDLIGKIAGDTQLTRKTVVDILSKIQKMTFDQFRKNPEEFIIRASEIIKEQKSAVIIEHITYNKLDSTYDTSIFTETKLNGQLGKNAIQVNKHLYDYLVYDSNTERDFVKELDVQKEVAVYVKLPGGFSINTPVGDYNPDWAIAFHEGKVKHIFFIAETKGDLSTLQFREVESLKIHCAREHFKAISNDKVKYDVVHSYNDLLDRVMK